MDELFDTAAKIFSNLTPETFDKEGNTETYEELLKMLHVFILPDIKFSKKERDDVSEVLRHIENQHEHIETLIQRKDNTKRNTENSLSKQRHSFLLTENFSSGKFISSLDEKFLRLFLQHLEKDIRKLNETLLLCDTKVTLLRNSTAKRDSLQLESARMEGNEINSAIERSITAREEIKNVISRKHVKKKYKKNRNNTSDFHQLYIEVTKRLDIVNSEIRDLIISKIKLSSVREAALLTLKEIDSDGVSYGYNRKKGSFEYETDLFDPTKKPEEWATLTERVKTYMQVKQAGFRSGYEKFCLQIKLKCEHLYGETKLFGMSQSHLISPTTAQFIDVIGGEAVRRRSHGIPRTDNTEVTVKHAAGVPWPRGYSTRWSIGCIPKHECESICKEVVSHISDATYDLAVNMKGTKDIMKSFHNKLYVCYEEHVSSELMPMLSELYEKSYKEQCDNLADWLAIYSTFEIAFEEKTLENLFYGLSGSSEENSREVSGEIDEETEIKVAIGNSKSDTIGSMSHLTLEELYEKLNEQSENMPQSFIGALDMGYKDYLRIADDNCEDVFADGGQQPHEDRHPVVKEVLIGEEVRGNVESGDLPNGACGHTPAAINMDPKPPDYDEVVKRNGRQSNNPSQYSTLPLQRERFFKEFEQFYIMVQEEDEICTLFGKLRQMTRINKYIENRITKVRADSGHKKTTCTDDILDVIILLLCRLDAKWLLKLYSHLNLMIHLSPSFMQGNAHDYSLVNISVAYQHLFEQRVLHTSNIPMCK